MVQGTFKYLKKRRDVADRKIKTSEGTKTLCDVIVTRNFSLSLVKCVEKGDK